MDPAVLRSECDGCVRRCRCPGRARGADLRGAARTAVAGGSVRQACRGTRRVRTLALARFTFHEALRRRTVLAAAILTVLFLGLFTFGTHYAVRELETSVLIIPSAKPLLISQLLLTGMWISSLASGLVAIFTASGTISAEVESATLHAIAAKPLRRWEIVVGKWLGLAVMATVYTVILVGAVIAIVWLRAGYAGTSPLIAMAALAMQTLVL